MGDAITTPEIRQALESRDFAGVRRAFSEQLARDVAEQIEDLDEQERAILFRVLPREQAAETFEYFTPEAQEGLIKALAREQVAAILNDMSPDDRTALLEELPAAVTRQLLALLTGRARRSRAVRCWAIPRTASGVLMTPDFIAVRPGLEQYRMLSTHPTLTARGQRDA